MSTARRSDPIAGASLRIRSSPTITRASTIASGGTVPYRFRRRSPSIALTTARRTPPSFDIGTCTRATPSSSSVNVLRISSSGCAASAPNRSVAPSGPIRRPAQTSASSSRGRTNNVNSGSCPGRSTITAPGSASPVR